VADYAGVAASGGRLLRGHRLPVTAVALSADEQTVYSVSKDGAILQHDVETGQRQRFTAASSAGLGKVEETGTVADWVKRGPRLSGTASLLAAALSSDGRYLAVGGGDRKVHIWDARSRQYVRVSVACQPLCPVLVS
jgi:ribosomal RNA-processing protein 9